LKSGFTSLEGYFSRLNLSHASLYFPTPSREEREMIRPYSREGPHWSLKDWR